MEQEKIDQEVINRIAKQLNKIVENNVIRLQGNEDKYKNLHEHCIQYLELQIANYIEHQKELNENNLTINSIESEGYLRSLNETLKYFKELETDFL